MHARMGGSLQLCRADPGASALSSALAAAVAGVFEEPPPAQVGRLAAALAAILTDRGLLRYAPNPGMSDWLVVLSDDNWEVCATEGLLALGRDAERRLNRMADGDRAWVYVNRKHVDHQVPRVQQLRAMARVAGPVRFLERSPWKPRGDQRFTVARPIAVERRFAVPVPQLLKTMSFAGRPPAWGIRLLDAPLRLTAEDVTKFERAADSSPDRGWVKDEGPV
jgi:hypothetical protein